jgi:DNA-binding transcriptional MerR regulator
MPFADRLSLQELTDAAGVSVRTVRYYIAEGLLPAPMGSGPASFYTPNHLRRLRLIGRLKEAYLPLKEIRRRLEGVTDEAVEGLLGLDDAALFDPATWEQLRGDAGQQGSSALRYIDRVLEWQRPRSLRESAPIPFPRPSSGAFGARAGAREDVGDPEDWAPRALDDAEGGEGGADEPFPAEARRSLPAYRRAPGKGADIAPAPVASAVAPRTAGPREAEVEPERWRRIPLGPGVDLMVGEEVYARARDKVDWLVRQARRVFG